ncbi:MAG: radical SAM protein [Thermoproteota archaeon]
MGGARQEQGYDPVKLADAVENAVTRLEGGVQYRRYHRFRRDRWYGGIVTADVVGCNLRCGFCWAWRFTWTGYERGRMLSPAEVSGLLASMARRHGVKQARLSGGEPTVAFDHMMEVAERLVEQGLHFVLETNGILIGAREDYARRLASLGGAGIEVRVSVKGTSPEEFWMLTRARPEAWWLQIRALEALVRYGLKPGDEVYPAVMLSFTDEKGVERIKRILASIHPELQRSIDPEYVILYPHVKRLLRMTGLRPRRAYNPDSVPPELV